MSLSIFFTLLLSVVSVLCTPPAGGYTCNRDNVLRALVDKRHIDEALPFCSTYIDVPAATVTATSSCVTELVTLVIDRFPVTTTTTPTITVTVGPPISTIYSNYEPPSTTTDPPYYMEKRYQPVPSFVSQYPPSRISSACSCLTIPLLTTAVPCTVTSVVTLDPEPLTITETASPPATTTQTLSAAFTTLPALCNPAIFQDYQVVVDTAGFGEYVSSGGATQVECCLGCFKTKNCTAFRFFFGTGPIDRCEHYVRREATDPSDRTDLCPLGVTHGSRLKHPTSPIAKRDGFNYGPCLDKSPLAA